MELCHRVLACSLRCTQPGRYIVSPESPCSLVALLACFLPQDSSICFQAMGSALSVLALLVRAGPARLRLVIEGERFISPGPALLPFRVCCSSLRASTADWRLSPGAALRYASRVKMRHNIDFSKLFARSVPI